MKRPARAPDLAAALDPLLARHFGAHPGALAAAAVCVVARPGDVLYERAVGEARVDTVFDLASVTKAVFTAPLLMMLVDKGRLDLDGPLGAVLPELADPALAAAPVAELLRHRAGLWEWRPLYVHARHAGAALDFVLGLSPRHPPGSRFAYSDLGLMLAGEIASRGFDAGLDGLLRERLVAPLGLRRTAFRPPPAPPDPAVAPTSRGDWYERRMVESGHPHPVPERASGFDGWRQRTLQGEANDGNAFHAFGGVAAHAGLFAPARDLVRLGEALLANELVAPATLARFTAPGPEPGQGLVFRLTELAGAPALWHPGFTGTRWLLCPRHRLVVVLLSNRLHVAGEPRPVDEAWDAVLQAVAGALATG